MNAVFKTTCRTEDNIMPAFTEPSHGGQDMLMTTAGVGVKLQRDDSIRHSGKAFGCSEMRFDGGFGIGTVLVIGVRIVRRRE